MLNIRSYPQVTAVDEISEFCHKLSTRLKKLTDLQTKVVSNAEFWKNDRNLLIQSTAGTGKTLLPLIALMSNPEENRKLLYLVPYRALLNEKFIQFKQYFGNENKICRSSSDYFEYDADIFSGDCDIAIVIYEKLENYLHLVQNSERIFSSYDLIVFDELSLLTTINRGLRIHYILRKYIRYASQNYGIKPARIIGLTVPGCNIPTYDYLNFYSFINEERQIKIHEAIYQMDEQRFYPKNQKEVWPFEIKIEQMPEDTNTLTDKGKLEEPEIDTINTRLFLRQLILQHRKEGHNIIVFCNNKNSTRGIAKFIADSIKENNLPHGNWNIELGKIKDELGDNAYGCINNKLLYCSSYGVMIHNAELPNAMRVKIEQEFSRRNGKSRINILISTETLAYGINCSADVVIVYNRSKITDADDYPRVNSSRGDYYWRYINYIEYQNYIGRAGRMGFQKNHFQESQKGFAYTLTLDSSATRTVRKKYYECAPNNINNCLQLFDRKLKKDVQGCIIDVLDYIDLYEREVFTENNLKEILSYLTGKRIPVKRTDLTDSVLKEMIHSHLIESEGNGEYSLTRQGEALKGKHVPLEAAGCFSSIYRSLKREGRYEYTTFLLLFEMIGLVESADYNLLPRKKDLLEQFAEKCVSYFLEMFQSEKINLVAKEHLIWEVDKFKTLIDDSDVINEEGFFYLSGELLRLVKKFTNSVLLCEWSKGVLLEKINKKFNLKISLGYVQNIVNSFNYLAECLEQYLKKMGVENSILEEIEKTKLEVKYGYPFRYIKASEMKLYIPYRPLICNLIENNDESIVENILQRFVASEEFDSIHNGQECGKIFRKFLKKYNGGNEDEQ